MNTSAQSLQARIGKYRLLAELGSGGMAHVFLAVVRSSSGFSKLVVLKVLRQTMAREADSLQMFLDEARLAGRLNHPNVVQTYEVTEMDGQHVIIMEYLDGQPLSSVLGGMSRLEVAQRNPMYALRAVVDALGGLHYAHEAKDYDGGPLNLVHRDVSPQNIFITYDGQVKVLDVGIAKAVTSMAETRQGVLKGKLGYMAPERFTDEGIDRRVDIYAMGVVLWEILAGQRLWKRQSEAQLVHKILSGQVQRPSELVPGVPETIERVCMRSLARNRDERYSTAADFQADLESAIATVGTSAGARDLGTFVAELFAEQRQAVTSAVESQLSATLTDDECDVEVPGAEDDSDARRSNPVASCSGSVPPGLARLGNAGDWNAGSSDKEIVVDWNTQGSGASKIGVLQASLPSQAVAAGAARRRTVLALVLIAGVLVVAVVGGLGLGKSKGPDGNGVASIGSEQRSYGASAGANSAAATVSATAQPNTVVVEIEAKPTRAKITYDSEVLAANPSTKHIARDGRTHRLRVEAEGYETQTIEFIADKDRVLVVVLDKLQEVAPKGQGEGQRISGSTKGGAAATAAKQEQAVTQPSSPASDNSSEGASDGLRARPKRKTDRKVDVTNPWE